MRSKACRFSRAIEDLGDVATVAGDPSKTAYRTEIQGLGVLKQLPC